MSYRRREDMEELYHKLTDEMRSFIDTSRRREEDLLFMVGMLLYYKKELAFTTATKELMQKVVRQAPFNGNCPCCMTMPVLESDGSACEWTQHDHFYSGCLNRPEHGWPICSPCHLRLHSNSRARMSRYAEFHRFRTAVLNFQDS